jgi:hypothetical protein
MASTRGACLVVGGHRAKRSSSPPLAVGPRRAGHGATNDINKRHRWPSGRLPKRGPSIGTESDMPPTTTNEILGPPIVVPRTTSDCSADRTTESAAATGLAWNAFAGLQPGDTVVQTTAWSEAKRRLGYDVAHAVVGSAAAVSGGAQIVIRRLGPLAAVGYVARGPLLEGRDEAAIARGLEAVEGVARAAGVSLLVVQPPETGESIEAMLDRRGYSADALEVAPTATLRIDLGQDEQQILAGMSATRRRHLRAIERSGRLRLRLGGEADLEPFHRLHAATAARQDFEPMSLTYLRAHWEALAPSGWVRLVLAELDGAPIAGVWLTAFGDSLIYRLGGWAGDGGEHHPNEACHWWAVRWGRQQGFRWYDTGGISRSIAELLVAGTPMPPTLQHSPAWFKRQFGGAAVLLPTPRLKVFNPLARPLAHTALRLLRRRPLTGRVVGWLRGGG